MTGFGRAEGVVKDRKVTVEVRSLNSKQLDLLVKVPSLLKEREVEVRQWAGEQLVRGKAELTIGIEQHAQKRTTFDKALIQAYYAELSAIAQEIAPDHRTDLLAQVLRLPEVTTTTTDRVDEEEWTVVMGLVRQAVEAFDRFRSSEGGRLAQELGQRVLLIGQLLEEVETLDQGRADRTREKLRARLAELQVSVDHDRFEQELVYYLEKMDLTEERVRLRSHCTYFMETMEKDEHQGRKLGFIAQEMGREINTLGSKANDATVQRLVVRMKDELEKIKEQVLNVL
ncbi:MAG TPA: YicC family protein [Flavobacteriales bacterium]|nr:YicC family protein [Flavobacteriales bacterium]